MQAEPDFAGASWRAFLAATEQATATAPGGGVSAARGGAAAPAAGAPAGERFAAIAAYERAGDVQAHPVAHIDRLLQV